MKKNIILIFSSICIVGFFLVLPIFFFFGANKLLESGNIELAGKIYSKLGNIFPQNDFVEMKKADVLYKQKKYQEALVKYLQVECKNTDMCFILQHNLGNTLYRFGDTFEEKEQKKKFWEQSLGSYKEALSYKMDLQTEQNYEFVLKKLKELEEPPPPESQNQQQPEQKEEKKDESQSQQEQEEKQQSENHNEDQQQEQKPQENNQAEKPQEQDQDQNGQPGEIPTNPNTGIGGDISEVEKELSDTEKVQIEQYLEGLKQEEKQNSDLNKPGKQNDFFGNEGFFFDENKKNTDW